jgi:hypothetical protein
MRDEGRGTRDEMTAAKRINGVRDLDVYRMAFDAAMEIYSISKGFVRREIFINRSDPKVFTQCMC